MKNCYKTFEAMLAEAGLLYDQLNRKRTLYSLRHSYISFRLYEKDGLRLIARNTGTEEKQIREHYDHLTSERFEDDIAVQTVTKNETESLAIGVSYAEMAKQLGLKIIDDTEEGGIE